MTTLTHEIDGASGRLASARGGNATVLVEASEVDGDTVTDSDKARQDHHDDNEVFEIGTSSNPFPAHETDREPGAALAEAESDVAPPTPSEPPTPVADMLTASEVALTDGHAVGQVTALALAEEFLRREEIGLFELMCHAAEKLCYETAPAETAILMGCVAREEYAGQQRYREALAGWTEHSLRELPASVAQGSRLLVFASLILPAITNPASGARDVLRQLDLSGFPDAGACHMLRVAILDLGPDYPALAAMRPPGDIEEARKSLQDACAAYDEFLQNAHQRTLSYQPATAVWQSLLREPAISEVSMTGAIQPAALKVNVERAFDLLDRPDALIDRIDEQRRRNTAKRRPIISSARQTMLNGIAKLVDHLSALKNCLEIMENANGTPGRRPDERGGKIRTLCNAAAKALGTETVVGASGGDPFAQIASRLIKAQADALEKGHFRNPFAEAFRLDRYRLSPSARRPDEAPDVVWHALQQNTAEPHRSWLEVFDRAIEHDDHLAAGAVLPLAQQADPAAIRNLDTERKDAIARARQSLARRRAEVLQDVTRAMNYAPSTDTELDALRVEIDDLRPDDLPLPLESTDGSEAPASTANTIADFPAAHERLDAAQRAVATVERNAISGARDRIAELKVRESAEIIDYLNDLVLRSDLITLMEELPLVGRGQRIALAAPPESALEAFAAALKEVETNRVETNSRLRELASPIDHGESRSVNLARAWLQLIEAPRGHNPSQPIRDLLTQIGFVVEGKIVDGDRTTRFLRSLRLSTRRIADRETCAVADFGSIANGRYHVVVAEKDAKPAEIIDAIPTSGVTFLLIKNALAIQERLELAKHARQKDRAFCLLDTELVLFLAGRANPLADFFACGIPFGAASPFALQPGSIPVEVFFGRGHEMSLVFEPDGTCIVYGGRQLGKSVMLDHVAKTRDVPGRVLVRCADCQAILNQAADVWRIIAEALAKAGLTQFAAARTPEQIIRAIRNWLEPSERRILLMLDETNEFVVRDAENGFTELLRLRGLMESTGWRFKVVLSGQHNVLRMTHNPNTPLAHFGEPVAIGPLRGGDLKAARQLVTEPLAAVGYKFADHGLVSRILAETQYYPKLIQIICQNLLRHMRRPAGGDQHRDLPPWTIQQEDINAVLRNNDIRKEIFNNFHITLQLDKRYELISLIVADKLYDRKSGHDSRVGFSVQELMDEAFRFWPKGFPSSGKREVFHALLDELVGLGILIEDSSSGRYQLRSPIIGSMIGTAEQVEDRLLAFETEAPPPKIEPERRRMPVGPRDWPILSPLVPAQIDTLLLQYVAKVRTGPRIAIVFGTASMGTDRIVAALQATAVLDKAVVHRLEAPADRAAFLRKIASMSKDQQIYIVPAETPWKPDWVCEAAEIKGKTRLVFVGDGAHAWRCHVEAPGALALGKVVPCETLMPLSAEEIEDQLLRNSSHIPDPRTMAKRIHDVTGGFLTPFATALKVDAKGDVDRALTRFTSGEINPQDFGIPIIEAARKAVGALLGYVLPSEEVRVSDLQSIEKETGVDGLLFANWLIGVGLAEPGILNGRGNEDNEGIRLNPILRHPLLLRDLCVVG
jgi:hypothetical protein